MELTLKKYLIFLSFICCFHAFGDQAGRRYAENELKAIGDLHLAFEKGDLSKVRQCLESGNIECVRGKASFRVLHRAAEAGNKSMVRFLIQKKANVNAMAMQGWTPLDLAQKKEQFEWIMLNPTGKAVEFAGRHAIDPLFYTRDSPNKAIRNP